MSPTGQYPCVLVVGEEVYCLADITYDFKIDKTWLLKCYITIDLNIYSKQVSLAEVMKQLFSTSAIMYMMLLFSGFGTSAFKILLQKKRNNVIKIGTQTYIVLFSFMKTAVLVNIYQTKH